MVMVVIVPVVVVVVVVVVVIVPVVAGRRGGCHCQCHSLGGGARWQACAALQPGRMPGRA